MAETLRPINDPAVIASAREVYADGEEFEDADGKTWRFNAEDCKVHPVR